MHDELQLDISLFDEQLAKMESSRKFDFDLLEEVLAMTRNIPKSYKEAPQFLKKKYLHFFFDEIVLRDKKIENMGLSPLVQELVNQQQVILRTIWLPLKDLFRNQELELGYTPQDLKVFLTLIQDNEVGNSLIEYGL